MNLFADRPKCWPSSFNESSLDPKSSDSMSGFHSSDRQTPSSSHGDNYQDVLHSNYGDRNLDATLLSRRILDHLDSIIYDLTAFDSRQHYNESVDPARGDLSKHSVLVNEKDRSGPREFVIPIRIETTTNSDYDRLFSSGKVEKDDSKSFGSVAPAASRQDDSKRCIQIPIIRVSSSQTSSRGNSLSPVVPDCFETSSGSSRSSIPRSATVRDVCTPIRSSQRDQLGNGSTSKQSPAHSAVPQREASSKHGMPVDVDPSVVKIVEEVEEEETVIRSLRRNPARSFQKVRSFSFTPSPEISELASQPEESSSRCDVKGDGRLDEDRSRDRNEIDSSSGVERKGKRQLLCSSAGPSDVTPSPSYPIYDLLKPRLASTGRQVDYIRGDGNCFFRALSKEMYGSEDYHAEWREAVCDLIGDHPQVFGQFVDSSSVSQHVCLMRRLGTWATSCEIYGAATLLRRKVYVLAPSPSEEKEYHWLLFCPCSLSSRSLRRRGGGGGGGSGVDASEDEDEDEEGAHPCYLTLCLTNGNHYDRITPVEAGVCNCQMAPPSLNGASVMLDDGEELGLPWKGC